MRDRIVCESIESLRWEGLRFSVDALAKRLNISKKTIYKYFPTKEDLAFALYHKYYADITAQAHQLAAGSKKELLSLYFDAISMTSSDNFNKYMLNETLRSFTAEQNDSLLEIILSSLHISQQDKESIQIIINGSFEKLCNDKTAPEGVIDWLVNMLW